MPMVSITPSLHKLTAHSIEIVFDYNKGYGIVFITKYLLPRLLTQSDNVRLNNQKFTENAH